MVFKNLCCLLPSKNGKICGKHLADVAACTETTIRFTCPAKHSGDTDKLEFTQDRFGTIHWRPIPMIEKKMYDDDGVRIGTGEGDDLP